MHRNYQFGIVLRCPDKMWKIVIADIFRYQLFSQFFKYILMEDNELQNEQMEFSIIGPSGHKPNQIDFSVESLLTVSDKKQTLSINAKQQSSLNNAEDCPLDGGSFMRDLGKLQKSVSYQSAPYNIYEPSQNHAEITRTLEGKQESTCTKTINNIQNMTNITKGNSLIGEPDFKHLIIDFNNPVEHSNIKLKQNFQNYFGCLDSIRIKGSGDPSKNSTKSTHKPQRKSSDMPITTVTQMCKLKPTPSHPSLKSTNDHLPTSSSKSKINKARQFKNKKQLNSNSKKKIHLYRQSSKTTIYTNRSHSRQQSQNSHERSKSSKKMFKKNKQKGHQKAQQAVYSEYFGFSSQKQSDLPKQRHSKLKPKPSKSKSKGKTIVFSTKNMKQGFKQSIK